MLQAYYLFTLPFPFNSLLLLLLLFFIFSPIFFLFAAILSFWLRRYEMGGRKKILNILMYLSLFSFFLSVWYLYPAFTQKTVGGNQRIPTDYFENPEKYPDILLNKKP
jgi:hypothetical protein